MSQFLEPTSAGLLVTCGALSLGMTAATAYLWDRKGWVAVRAAGPLVSLIFLAVAALVALNLATSLFDTWREVWVFAR